MAPRKEAPSPTAEQEIDRLFGLPLADFTAARNELAKRLKKDGDAAASEAVRRLPKPTVAAWAANQLARREPDAVRALLNVGARLRAAQERALQGEPARDELRAAQAEERDTVRALTHRAEPALREARHAASGGTLERISSLLRAAAKAEPGRTALREGRLSGDVEAVGFEVLAGVDASRSRRTAPKSDDLAERRRQKREAEQKRRQLEKRVRELSARADAADRDAERARTAAAEAEAVAADRRREADAVAAELAGMDQ